MLICTKTSQLLQFRQTAISGNHRASMWCFPLQASWVMRRTTSIWSSVGARDPVCTGEQELAQLLLRKTWQMRFSSTRDDESSLIMEDPPAFRRPGIRRTCVLEIKVQKLQTLPQGIS